MASGMMAAASGILCISFLAFLPSFFALSFLCLCVWCLFAYYRWQPVFILACFLSGMVWGCWYGERLEKQLLPEALERQDLWVEGLVSGLPETNVQYGRLQHRFEFRVQRAACLTVQPTCELKLGKIRLATYGGKAPRVGERWFFSVRLRRPRGFANPGGFDYGAWLVGNGFHASGYVTDKQTPSRIASASSWLGWRAQLRDLMQQQLASFSHGSILLALAVGDRSGLEPQAWQRYQRTGTTHLMAISGLHIGIVVGCGLLLGKVLTRFLALLGWRWPSAYLLLGLVAGLIYSYLAGFGLPTRRALLMCLLAMIAYGLKRYLSLWWLWSAALFLVLVSEPLSGYLPGFWLSFGAVAVLIFGLSGRTGQRQQLSWRPQWVVFIGLFPILMLATSQLSLLSLPANLLAVPVFSLLIVPLNFLALLLLPLSDGVAHALWAVCNSLLALVDSFLRLLSSREWGFWLLPSGLPLNRLLPGVLGVIVLLMPRGWPGRWLGLLLISPLLLWRPAPAIGPGQLEVAILDVGQGLSVVLRTRHHSLVYDLGPRYSDRFNTAEAVVQPFLAAKGIDALDVLLISHGDNDHAGGAVPFSQSISIERILSGESVPGLEEAEPCRAGQRWVWDSVLFEILHPSGGSHYGKSNNRSCVLRVQTGNQSVLLTGDIEGRVESSLLQGLTKRQASTSILVAPHHGSASSSGRLFVQTLAPEHVVFSAGYKHHFGHPRADVVQRYREQGATIWQTARDGALQFSLTPGQPVTIDAWRHNHGYYWQARAFEPLP